MTLPFQTQWPKYMGELAGQPTNFINKLWRGFFDYNKDLVMPCPALPLDMFPNQLECLEHEFAVFMADFERKFNHSIVVDLDVIPKIHTIRYDPSDRWQPGMKIHMVVWNRTKNRFQFSPTLEVKSTQKVRIVYKNNPDYAHLVLGKKPLMYFHEDDFKEMTQLALNDGFDSTHNFFKYFNESATLKIIHWTDFRY